jgi:hypothetical protein
VYWLEFLPVRSLKILKGSGGGPDKGQNQKKILKKQNTSVGPVKVDVLNKVFILFEAILGAVFDNNIFKPANIMKGTFSDPSLPKKWFLKGNFGGI